MSRKSLALLFLVLLALTWAAFLRPTVTTRGREIVEHSRPTPPGGPKSSRSWKTPFRIFGRLFGSRHREDARRSRPSAEERFESSAVARLVSGEEERTRDNYLAETLDRSAGELLEEGRRLLRLGKHREATTVLSRAVSLDPSLKEARLLLATAFDLQGMDGRAASYYRGVIAERERLNDRETALALNNQGYSHYLRGEYQEAIRLLSQAVRLEEGDSRFWNNLGLAYYRLQRHKEALKAFARAGGETEALLNVALLFDRDGRDSDARKYYERARRSAPASELVREKMAAFAERMRTKELQAARVVDNEGADEKPE